MKYRLHYMAAPEDGAPDGFRYMVSFNRDRLARIATAMLAKEIRDWEAECDDIRAQCAPDPPDGLPSKPTRREAIFTRDFSGRPREVVLQIATWLCEGIVVETDGDALQIVNGYAD